MELFEVFKTIFAGLVFGVSGVITIVSFRLIEWKLKKLDSLAKKITYLLLYTIICAVMIFGLLLMMFFDGPPQWFIDDRYGFIYSLSFMIVLIFGWLRFGKSK